MPKPKQALPDGGVVRTSRVATEVFA
jgi:hypothetical protein